MIRARAAGLVPSSLCLALIASPCAAAASAPRAKAAALSPTINVSTAAAREVKSLAFFEKAPLKPPNGAPRFSAGLLNLLFDDNGEKTAQSPAVSLAGSWARPAEALTLRTAAGIAQILRIPPPRMELPQTQEPDVFSSLLHRIGVYAGAPLDSADRAFSRAFNQDLDQVLMRTSSGRKLVRETAAHPAPILLQKTDPDLLAYYNSGKNAVFFNTLSVAPRVFPESEAKRAADDPEFLTRYLLDHAAIASALAESSASTFFHEKTHQLQDIQGEDCDCVEQEEQAFIASASDYDLEALRQEPKNRPINLPRWENLLLYAQDDRAFKNSIIQAYARDKLDDARTLGQMIRGTKRELMGWQGRTALGAYFLSRSLGQEKAWERYYSAYFAREHARWPEVSWEVYSLAAERSALGDKNFLQASVYFTDALQRGEMSGLMDAAHRARMQQVLNEVMASAPRKPSDFEKSVINEMSVAALSEGLLWPKVPRWSGY